MQRNSVTYIVGFAAAVCAVCSLVVSAAAVVLKDRQIENAALDKMKNIVGVSGLIEDPKKASREEVNDVFSQRVVAKVIELKSGDPAPEGQFDPLTYDYVKVQTDPELSVATERNKALVPRVPKYITIYEVNNEAGELELLVLPVQGKGLWSTLYGFVALESDYNTIRGLTFYKHGETPGLGGEVDNPSWKGKWPGRKAFDADGNVAIKVIKGAAPSPADAPHMVDGLSGATLTANGVTFLLDFWLGDTGFGPYLSQLNGEGSDA